MKKIFFLFIVFYSSFAFSGVNQDLIGKCFYPPSFYDDKRTYSSCFEHVKSLYSPLYINNRSSGSTFWVQWCTNSSLRNCPYTFIISNVSSINISDFERSPNCKAGDPLTYLQTVKKANEPLTIYIGEQPKSIIDGCEYTCDTPGDEEYIMPNGDIVQECTGVATGVSSTANNSDGVSTETPDPSSVISSPVAGCISGSNGSVLCPKDNTDCMTVNGISLCKTAENPSGCVTVPDVLNNPVELCSGQNKECVVKNGSLMCVVDPNSSLPKDCVKSASTGEIACLTTDGQALKVKTESSTVTNPDGSVTETTVETNNVLCPAVQGRARSISPNPAFFTDGTAVIRDSNGRVLNQYPCDDQKKTVKTTHPDGSVSKTETGNLDKFKGKNGGSSDGENQNGTDMSGVESRLDTANSHLDSINKSLNPDGSSNPQGQIDGVISSLSTAESSRNSAVSDYFSNLSNPFAGIVSPVSIFPNIFPNSVSCGSGYVISDTFTVPFTGKVVNFNLDPCVKFAPLREILTWLLFVFTVFKVVNIATGQKVGR